MVSVKNDYQGSRGSAMSAQKIKSLCVTAMFAAMICILSPITVPLASAVPISLASFAVYLTAGILDVKNSVAAVGIYILLGAVGLPVFSSFQGGLQKLVGVTGGYIIGYLPLAFIVSILLKRRSKLMYPVSMIIGTSALYSLGTIWFVLQTKSSFSAALASCVLPFIPGDIIKITAAGVICKTVYKRLENTFLIK